MERQLGEGVGQIQKTTKRKSIRPNLEEKNVIRKIERKRARKKEMNGKNYSEPRGSWLSRWYNNYVSRIPATTAEQSFFFLCVGWWCVLDGCGWWWWWWQIADVNFNQLLLLISSLENEDCVLCVCVWDWTHGEELFEVNERETAGLFVCFCVGCWSV